MALPKIELPTFELTLPSTGKDIKYRPFTVKEEKILLIAQESKDSKQVLLAVKQIIDNCVLSEFDVANSPSFDLEYILLNLRAKSVNDIIEFTINDPDTDENINLSVNVNEIEVRSPKEGVKDKVALNETYTLILKYPSLNDLQALSVGDADATRAEVLFEILVACIDSVVSTDGEVMKMKDFSSTEVMDFINSFPSEVVNKIKEFFDNMPQIRIEREYELSDGTKKTFILQGIESFFI